MTGGGPATAAMLGLAILMLTLITAGQALTMSNPRRVAEGELLYQSDILLSEEQWEDMRMRKAINKEKYRWTEGSDGYPLVPYVFLEEAVDQDAVRSGMDHWMKHTCIKFEETSNTDQPHMQFHTQSRCRSAIGMWYWQNGEEISIGPNCNTLEIVVHELGHAIGFYHEQSRSDRDEYVTILWDNIDDDRYGSFDKEDTNNYNVPYDYSSNMHYKPALFSKNDKPTMLAKDPMAQELLGSFIGLTHRDKLLANRMYNCIGKWLTKCGLSSDPCLNDGYTGKDCICVCPPGTSGSNCEDVVDDYYAQLRNPLSEKISTEKSITIETPMDSGTMFVKWIVPSACKRAKLTFTSSNMYSGECKYQNLNVRTDPSVVDGQIMCPTDVSTGVTLTSDTAIILTMWNNVNYDFQRTLWEADVTFENIPECSATNPPTPAPTNPPTQPPTPAPTNPPTPAPTNPPTQAPTPAPTNPPTPAPTNPPTQPPTPSPTIPPTSAPTNPPTQPPTPAPTTPPTTATSAAPIPTDACQEKYPIRQLVSKGNSLIITSPNFPQPYSEDKIRCGWKLMAPKKSLLTITCDTFDLNGSDALLISRKDFKEINATSYKAKRMAIRFKSRKNSSGTGFRCTVSSN